MHVPDIKVAALDAAIVLCLPLTTAGGTVRAAPRWRPTPCRGRAPAPQTSGGTAHPCSLQYRGLIGEQMKWADPPNAPRSVVQSVCRVVAGHSMVALCSGLCGPGPRKRWILCSAVQASTATLRATAKQVLRRNTYAHSVPVHSTGGDCSPRAERFSSPVTSANTSAHTTSRSSFSSASMASRSLRCTSATNRRQTASAADAGGWAGNAAAPRLPPACSRFTRSVQSARGAWCAVRKRDDRG